MGKEIGRYFKYNRSKMSTPILKKPVLSSSAAHTSSANNSTGTSVSVSCLSLPVKTNTTRQPNLR